MGCLPPGSQHAAEAVQLMGWCWLEAMHLAGAVGGRQACWFARWFRRRTEWLAPGWCRGGSQPGELVGTRLWERHMAPRSPRAGSGAVDLPGPVQRARSATQGAEPRRCSTDALGNDTPERAGLQVGSCGASLWLACDPCHQTVLSGGGLLCWCSRPWRNQLHRLRARTLLQLMTDLVSRLSYGTLFWRSRGLRTGSGSRCVSCAGSIPGHALILLWLFDV